MKSRQTKEAAVLAALKPGRWLPHLRLRDIGGTRFTARLWDAKQRGFRFQRRWRNGGWEYARG